MLSRIILAQCNHRPIHVIIVQAHNKKNSITQYKKYQLKKLFPQFKVEMRWQYNEKWMDKCSMLMKMSDVKIRCKKTQMNFFSKILTI